MTLSIKLDSSNCSPGQVLNALVGWEFESNPSPLLLELVWHTSGKGTEDTETVYTKSWSPDSNRGEKSFSIALPPGPISVPGNLFSIEWHLKCMSSRPKEMCISTIVISPLDDVVRLTSSVA